MVEHDRNRASSEGLQESPYIHIEQVGGAKASNHEAAHRRGEARLQIHGQVRTMGLFKVEMSHLSYPKKS